MEEIEQKNLNKLLGIIISVIHFLIFVLSLQGAMSHDAQWQLSWIPLSIIDFPISMFLLPLATLTSSLNFSAFIVLGIGGTLWWYWLTTKILNKFFTKSS